MSIILEVTKKDFTGTLYNDRSFFYSSKRTVCAKSLRLTLPLFTWFSYLLLCQELEFIGFRHGNKKQLPPEKKNTFCYSLQYEFLSHIYLNSWYSAQAYWCDQYVLLQFELLTLLPKHQPTSDPHESLLHEQIFICPGLCTPFIQSGKKDKFPWQAGKKNENKEIYIAAAVQRLQEAWHVPICPAEVADSRNETIYHVDTHSSSQGNCHRALLKLLLQNKKSLNKH